MPRRPRLELPGTPLHIIQRGVNRCAIFADDVDRRHYYDLLCDAASTYGIAVHAYVFMGSHIHLPLTSPQPGALSLVMRNTGQCYVQSFNRRHRRSGTLWQGRFKSCVVETERYLMTLYRYIELNPVRAAMVERPKPHRWSSVHANLGLLKDPLVAPHSQYLALDPDTAIRTEAYRAWLHAGVSDDDLQRIRAHLQQERVLGDATFQNMVQKALGRPVSVRPRGRQPAATTGANEDEGMT